MNSKRGVLFKIVGNWNIKAVKIKWVLLKASGIGQPERDGGVEIVPLKIKRSKRCEIDM